jgi:hypothetical protein
MRKKANSASIFISILLIAIIGGVVFIYNSSMFDRNPPVVTMQNDGYWNLATPLHVKIQDQRKIKNYDVTLQIGNKSFTLAKSKEAPDMSQVSFDVKAPREAMLLQAKEVSIEVKARDTSNWNFFRGNVVKKKFVLTVDTTPPAVTVISHSYSIARGGSAVVVFQATDAHLKNIYIETSFKKDFIPQPFYKKGYYISLLAWPITHQNFMATIVATDLAGNVSRQYIPLYLLNRKFTSSKIKLSDGFLNGKVATMAQQYPEANAMTSNLKKFQYINSKVRGENEKTISTQTSKVDINQMVSSFHIKPIYPLVDAALVAHYGDHRSYYYNGELASQSTHMGIDLASIRMAKIRTTNPGVVAYAHYNGIYGNMLLIDHGLGLYTLYGHCSRFLVKQGEHVHAGQVVARTGQTGDAMGDHLHFDVVVQGVEIRPQAYMDPHWIKVNITKIIDNAKKIIDRQ